MIPARRSLLRAGLPALLAAVSLLPHLGAIVPGQTYYFRDFGIAFYPFRLFLAREIAGGRWPFWNPYIHEGTFVFPMYYPVDFLHVLWPSPEGVSWLLTLHFPLAGLCAYALARDLGAGRTGAFVSGAVYALGGFAVASLNLYVFLQALALAPLVALLIRRAAAYGGRWIPAAGVGLAVSLTTAQEFVAQAVVLGMTLGLGWTGTPARRAAPRMLLAIILGTALAGVPVALIAGILPETARGQGLTPDAVLSYALHPAVLFQVLLRDLFGSLVSTLDLWWGHRFFTKAYPYFISLYLGPPVVALAVTGAGALPRRQAWILLGLGALALWYAMGAWGGLAPLLASMPGFRSFRYPSKALLLPYMVVALLAGRGIERLRHGSGWRPFLLATGAVSALLLGLSLLAATAADVLGEWFGSDPRGNPILGAFLAKEALLTGIVALLGVGVALAVRARSLAPERAAALLAIVAVLDLARAAAGLNPQTSSAFFEPLPGMATQGLQDLQGGRVFTLGTDVSPSFRRYLARRDRDGILWGYFVRRQVLTPYVNVADRVEVAPIDDPGAFLFLPPDVASAEYHPALIGHILPRLRNHSVSRILSLDPLEHGELRLRAAVPAGPPGLAIHVYEVLGRWPRAYVACRVLAVPGRREGLLSPGSPGFDPERDVALEEPASATCRGGQARRLSTRPGEDVYEVETDGAGYLVTRDSHARGWHATVDGRPERVLRANGKDRAVPVVGGRHRVVLRYAPPGLTTGLLAMALAGVGVAVLWVRPVLQDRGLDLKNHEGRIGG